MNPKVELPSSVAGLLELLADAIKELELTHDISVLSKSSAVGRSVPTNESTQPPSFTPLALESRTMLPTRDAAFHLGRKEQTLRAWACLGTSVGIRPRRINGRLAWPVDEIRKLLGVDL